MISCETFCAWLLKLICPSRYKVKRRYKDKQKKRMWKPGVYAYLVDMLQVFFPADDKPWEVGSGLVARSYHFILYIFPHLVLHSDLSKQSFFHPTFYSLYFIQFLCGLQVFSPLISFIPFCLLHSLALSSCLISGSVDRQCYQHGVCVCLFWPQTIVVTVCLSGYLSIRHW